MSIAPTFLRRGTSIWTSVVFVGLLGCRTVDDHSKLQIATVVPAAAATGGFHDLAFDAGRCSSQETSWALDKNTELDGTVEFNDGGMGERYKNDKWNGLRVAAWNTNAEAYDAENSYITVTVRRGVPGAVGTTVTVDAHADCSLFAAKNWMWGTLRIYYKPY